MKALGIIPARYGSTRLEGKPLVDIEGKPMIQWVYESALQALDKVVVATDDQRIFSVVNSFGGEVVMTSPDHTTGTNRCIETLDIVKTKDNDVPDIVINIQGDEPLLHPAQIDALTQCFIREDTEMATLVIPVSSAEDLYNQSECFVVFDHGNNALYFSRSVIPHIHNIHKSRWMDHHTFYKHLGMYAYTPSALKDFAAMEQTILEKAESLEQNRWLENGRNIRIGITPINSIPVDTIDDLEKVRAIVRKRMHE